MTSASLDYYRALRDAASEAAFFQTYGNLYAFYLGDGQDPEQAAPTVDPRELPFVKEALASIDKGGYAEALARVAFLMAHKDEPLPLSRLHLAQELLDDYRELLPDLPLDEVRRIGGEQEIIARYEPEKAVETLAVLAKRKDRDRLLTLLERVLADQRVQRIQPSPSKPRCSRASVACLAPRAAPAGSRRGARLTPGRARVTIAQPRVALANKAAKGA